MVNKMDDGMENDWCYCHDCEEEYYLPEDTEKCPICNSENIAFNYLTNNYTE